MSVRTTFAQLPRCAAARVRHRGMVYCAAADCTPRVGFALRSAEHCALGVNANGMRMHNRGVCACVYYMYMARHMARRIATGSASVMRTMRRICGCGWCYSMSLL